MNTQSMRRIKSLRRKREKILSRLGTYREIMRGSLVLLRRRCGSQKKYPAYFLSKSKRCKTVMRYIRKDEVKRVRASLVRYRDLRYLIEWL